MADIRDQLRKAGLLSEKQLRQAKHQERVHATEVGHAGIEAERRAEEERQRAEAAARKEADRRHVDEQRRKDREEAAAQRLAQLVRGGWMRDATAGARRFFFVTGTGRVSFLDVSDIAARKLATGAAAIVETLGWVRGEHCVVTDRAVSEIARLRPEIVCFWNGGDRKGHEDRPAGPGGGDAAPPAAESAD